MYFIGGNRVIDNINEQLRKAQKAKEKDDIVKHPEKVKKAAIDYMKSTCTTRTPELKVNGHSVVFECPEHLKMMVDGKVITDPNEISRAINKIDMIGADMEKERTRKRVKDLGKKELKNIISVSKVSTIRSMVALPARTAESGGRIFSSLLQALWSFLQKGIQR